MQILILKCRPKAKLPIVSWLIMFFQNMMPWKKESYSHMAINSGSRVYDISGKGFANRNINDFAKKYYIIDSLSINVPPFYFESWIRSNFDKKYDRLQIVGLLLKSLGIISFNRLGQDYKKLICCELIVSMLKELKNAKVKDSDNYDLHLTWELAEEFRNA